MGNKGKENWSVLLGGRRYLDLGDGLELRVLSALEVLEARREAERLADGERELALCSNACLLARALERDGGPIFRDGGAVLEGMTAERIGALARRWAEFCQEEDPTPEDGEERVQQLKKAWSTRLMRAFNGVCSALLGRSPRRPGPRR